MGGLANEDAGETRRGSASAGPSQGPARGWDGKLCTPEQRRRVRGLARECTAPFIVTTCHMTRGITDARTLTVEKNKPRVSTGTNPQTKLENKPRELILCTIREVSSGPREQPPRGAAACVIAQDYGNSELIAHFMC